MSSGPTQCTPKPRPMGVADKNSASGTVSVVKWHARVPRTLSALSTLGELVTPTEMKGNRSMSGDHSQPGQLCLPVATWPCWQTCLVATLWGSVVAASVGGVGARDTAEHPAKQATGPTTNNCRIRSVTRATFQKPRCGSPKMLPCCARFGATLARVYFHSFFFLLNIAVSRREYLFVKKKNHFSLDTTIHEVGLHCWRIKSLIFTPALVH